MDKPAVVLWGWSRYGNIGYSVKMEEMRVGKREGRKAGKCGEQRGEGKGE